MSSEESQTTSNESKSEKKDDLESTDSSSSGSTSSEKQTTMVQTTEQNLHMLFRSSILNGVADTFPKNDKEMEIFKQEVDKNQHIATRLTCFDTTQQEELPDGQLAFCQIQESKALRCSSCMSLFTNPISLTCGHTFCAQCLIQKLLQAQEVQPIPQLDQFNFVDVKCPLCLTSQKCFHNKALADAISCYIQANPTEVVGVNQFMPEEATCYLCSKKIKYEKQIKKHTDDEVAETLGFVPEYCIYCRRYLCQDCIKSHQMDQYTFGIQQMKQIKEWKGEQIQKLMDLIPKQCQSTMNQVEFEFLLSKKSICEIYDEFKAFLQENFFAPIKQFVQASNVIDQDQFCCQRCVPFLFDVVAQFIRTTIRNEKPVCMCGAACRMQHTNREHAELAQHFGKGTRGDQSLSIFGE